MLNKETLTSNNKLLIVKIESYIDFNKNNIVFKCLAFKHIKRLHINTINSCKIKSIQTKYILYKLNDYVPKCSQWLHCE